MNHRNDSHSPHVVIAGGGFAAVEALLALRALAGESVRLTLVSSGPELVYRPAATVEAFSDAPARTYDLRTIASEVGATFHMARLESVGSRARYVRLSSGSRLSYDALMLAVGARAVANISGALVFRDQRDVPLFRRMLDDVDHGQVQRLVFTLPAGHCWAVPLYELALLSAARVSERGVDAEVLLVSPEASPLEVFGAEPSRMVAELLAHGGVRFIGGAEPTAVLRGGGLELGSGDVIEADRVIAAPQLRGQWITGVPTTCCGFVPVGPAGEVEGLPGVYAAGDVTNYPVKQAGLATQQADAIAQEIASTLGVAGATGDRSTRRILQARLLGGEHPLYLRAELDERGRATLATLARVASDAEAAQAKVFARYLTPCLAAHAQAPRRATA